jgi:hypothetical protein
MIKKGTREDMGLDLPAEQEHDEVGDQEGASAGLVDIVGEPPDVAQAHGIPAHQTQQLVSIPVTIFHSLESFPSPGKVSFPFYPLGQFSFPGTSFLP